MAELLQCRRCHRYVLCGAERANGGIACENCGQDDLFLVRTAPLISLRAKLFGWFSILWGVYATATTGSMHGPVLIAFGILLLIPMPGRIRTRLVGWAAVLGGLFAANTAESFIGLVGAVCGVLIVGLEWWKRDRTNTDAPSV